MAFEQSGSGLFVPSGLLQPQPAAEIAPDDPVEEFMKALVSSRPRATARTVLPNMAQLGLYNGIAEPDVATAQTRHFLRRIANTPLVRLVVSTLVKQMKGFGHQPKSASDTGYRIVLADTDAKPSPEDRKRMSEIAAILDKGGFVYPRDDDKALGAWSGDQQEEGDAFPNLLAKWTWDSLIFDWACVRLEPEDTTKKNGLPVAFLKVLDAERVYRTIQEPKVPQTDDFGRPVHIGYEAEMRKDERIDFVELNEQRKVTAEYPWAEVMPLVRNDVSNGDAMGYGWPELATLVEIVAGIAHAIRHNLDYFSANTIPAGIATIGGKYDKQQIFEFLQRIEKPNPSGSQYNKVAMLFGEPDLNVKYTPFRQTEKQDMYWRNWMVFLLNLIFAEYHVAAEEGNFQAFLSAGGMQSGTGGEARVSTMRWTGLRDTANTVEASINRHVVSRFYPDSTGIGPYRIEFVNVVPRDEEKQRQAEQLDLQGGLKSVNAILAARDERPIKDPKDRELWRRIAKAIDKLYPDLKRRNPVKYLDLQEEVYEREDGDWCLWPDAPQNGFLNQIWSQEHEEDLAPEQDPAEAWQQAQASGPPQEFTDNIDMNEWRRQREAETEQEQSSGPGGDFPHDRDKEDELQDGREDDRMKKGLFGRLVDRFKRSRKRKPREREVIYEVSRYEAREE